jgi:transcriptional regulator
VLRVLDRIEIQINLMDSDRDKTKNYFIQSEFTIFLTSQSSILFHHSY